MHRNTLIKHQGVYAIFQALGRGGLFDDRCLFEGARTGAHLGGGGYIYPCPKKKSVLKQAICPKNALIKILNDLKCPALGFISPDHLSS